MSKRKYNFVYKTTNNLNGKIYVGVHSTDDLNDGYMGSGKAIIRAFRKYGVEHFTMEILQFFETKEEAYKLEAKIVDDEFVRREDTYNLRRGGRGGFEAWNKGKKCPEHSERLKELYSSERGASMRKNLSEKNKGSGNPMYGTKSWCRGKKCPEHSERMKGSGNPMYGVPSPLKGKRHSPESIELMRKRGFEREARKTKEQQEAINRKIAETKRKNGK